MLKTKYFFLIILFIFKNVLFAQPNANVNNIAFKEGEFLKYRIHFGVINAGFATIKLTTETKNGQELYHASGKGWTVGTAKFFYVVKDTYESYFTKGLIKPIFHKRRVDEDGYIIRRDKYFDFENKTVTVEDLEKNTKKVYPIDKVQDMVSALYYLRNLDLNDIKNGSEANVNLFFDGESFPFRLKFIKKEIIKTKFGKVKTWKVQPLVQKGRVFESNESLTIWITDDENKIPIRIKASLAVGSLKADLDTFSGLANSFKIIADK
jgi:hypothetical protein